MDGNTTYRKAHDLLLASMTPEGKEAREEAMMQTNFIVKSMEEKEAVSEQETMSSREIAELTKKQHQHVKRDIENMMNKLKKDVSKYGHTYLDSMNRGQNEYLLPRFETEILITGYDVKRRAAVIHRWFELESGKAIPIVQLKKPELSVDLHIQLEKNIASTRSAVALAEALGFTGNQKLLSADRLLKSQIGFSPLEAMGQKAMSAPVQEMTFTPTQLGQMMTPPTNPREVNKLLEAAGLQIKIDNQWVPTGQGKPLCEILDTGKAHNTGTPVKQVKWYQTVLEQLKQQLKPASPNEPEPTNCSLDQEASHTEPVEVGSDTDDAPFRRNQKRKRNRYDLDDYFSLVELGEVIGRSRQHIVEVLEKHRIIKWTGNNKRGKYLLTDRGWQFGLMYDPCEAAVSATNTSLVVYTLLCTGFLLMCCKGCVNDETFELSKYLTKDCDHSRTNANMTRSLSL